MNNMFKNFFATWKRSILFYLIPGAKDKFPEHKKAADINLKQGTSFIASRFTDALGFLKNPITIILVIVAIVIMFKMGLFKGLVK